MQWSWLPFRSLHLFLVLRWLRQCSWPMMTLPFISPCYVHNWGNDHAQCWFYLFHLFLPVTWWLRQRSVARSCFLHLFLPILFSVVSRHQWEVVFVTCSVAHYAAGIRSYEIWACDVIACDDFFLCLSWSLPLVLHSYLLMIIVCDVDNT